MGGRQCTVVDGRGGCRRGVVGVRWSTTGVVAEGGGGACVQWCTVVCMVDSGKGGRRR